MSWKNIFGSSGELLGRTNEETGDTYAVTAASL